MLTFLPDFFFDKKNTLLITTSPNGVISSVMEKEAMLILQVSDCISEEVSMLFFKHMRITTEHY